MTQLPGKNNRIIIRKNNSLMGKRQSGPSPKIDFLSIVIIGNRRKRSYFTF
jgi:hypothetical protein